MNKNKLNKLRLNLCKKKCYSISVFKSNKNIYVQLFSFYREKILYSCSNLSFNIKYYIKLNFGNNLNINVFKFIGKYFSLILIKKNINSFTFDRSGFKYHGCIKELVNIMRSYNFKF